MRGWGSVLASAASECEEEEECEEEHRGGGGGVLELAAAATGGEALAIAGSVVLVAVAFLADVAAIDDLFVSIGGGGVFALVVGLFFAVAGFAVAAAILGGGFGGFVADALCFAVGDAAGGAVWAFDAGAWVVFTGTFFALASLGAIDATAGVSDALAFFALFTLGAFYILARSAGMGIFDAFPIDAAFGVAACDLVA